MVEKMEGFAAESIGVEYPPRMCLGVQWGEPVEFLGRWIRPLQIDLRFDNGQPVPLKAL